MAIVQVTEEVQQDFEELETGFSIQAKRGEYNEWVVSVQQFKMVGAVEGRMSDGALEVGFVRVPSYFFKEV